MAAQQTHTLAEISALDCVAWKEDYIYAHHRLLRMVALPSKTGGHHIYIRPTSLQERDAAVGDGWLHLNDCTCLLCTSPRRHLAPVSHLR